MAQRIGAHLKGSAGVELHPSWLPTRFPILLPNWHILPTLVPCVSSFVSWPGSVSTLLTLVWIFTTVCLHANFQMTLIKGSIFLLSNAFIPYVSSFFCSWEQISTLVRLIWILMGVFTQVFKWQFKRLNFEVRFFGKIDAPIPCISWSSAGTENCSHCFWFSFLCFLIF